MKKEIPNRYKVPIRLWKSFKSDESKKMFNGIMKTTLSTQSEMTHTKAKDITKEQWKTICHNFACIAAWITYEQAEISIKVKK